MKVPPKNIFGHFCMFGLVKGHFGLLGPKNSPPSGQTATYRKTEGIQSYLRIWRRYDPIELGPSEPNKGGLCGCSVKKSRTAVTQKQKVAQNGTDAEGYERPFDKKRDHI